MEYYDVLNQLAKGGQGTTLRVRRKQDKAVLVLKQSFCDDAKSGNDALREAKTLQGLEHPSIVRYEDVFLTEDGRQLVVCLVMAYMEGGDLARYMITVKKHGMTVEPNRVVLWTKQLAGAIAYLHTNKIVHRDLKPQNVFMADDNNLKVSRTRIHATRWAYMKAHDSHQPSAVTCVYMCTPLTARCA
jgi:NIMA (never in mitosis gene a)-related kinase